MRVPRSICLFAVLAVLIPPDEAALAEGPSFDCSDVEARSIEELICTDSALSDLDRKLADVYAAALDKAQNEHPPTLRAEQRGWIKGRDECWKSDDRRRCVEDEYRQRIAELQARYRLVAGAGPFVFACEGNPANEVVATFFRTDPSPTSWNWVGAVSCKLACDMVVRSP